VVEGNTRGLAVCAGARADRVDDDGEVCVTAVTWGELRFGDRRPGEMPRDEDEDGSPLEAWLRARGRSESEARDIAMTVARWHSPAMSCDVPWLVAAD